MLLIVRPGLVSLEWPMALPLVGALMWGLYQIMLRMVARDDAPETTLLWSAFIGLGAATLVVPFQWEPVTPAAWGFLLLIGILGAICHYGLIKAMDYADASAMQPYSYTLLVWASVMGVLVFGDSPAFWTFLGGAIVVASGLYTWHQDRRPAQRVPTP